MTCNTLAYDAIAHLSKDHGHPSKKADYKADEFQGHGVARGRTLEQHQRTSVLRVTLDTISCLSDTILVSIITIDWPPLGNIVRPAQPPS